MKKIVFIASIVSAVIMMSVQIFASTNIVKNDGTIYESPVDNDPSDANFVRAIDAKYGIYFETKRKFKTSKGDFNLNYAEFVTGDKAKLLTGNNNNYILHVNSGALKGFPMKVFLVAYDINGTVVDYYFKSFDGYDIQELGKRNQDTAYTINEGNPLGIAKIAFSINGTGLDPMIQARKSAASRLSVNIGVGKQFPDAYAYIYDPEYDLTDAEREKKYSAYLKDVEEYAADIKKRMEPYPEFYEVQ